MLTLYHGSPNLFENFSLDYVGERGTNEGYGIYLSNNIDVARTYADPYVYQVQFREGSCITKHTKMSLKAYQSLLLEVQKHTDILSDYGEIAFEGYQVVLKRALNAYNYCDNDIDLISQLANTCGSKELVNRLVYALFGVTHIVDDKPVWGHNYKGGHVVFVVLIPELVTVTRVWNTNELSTPKG